MIRGFATYGQAVMLAKIGNNLVARYQQRLFDHLMKLGVGFFTRHALRRIWPRRSTRTSTASATCSA